MTTPARKPRGVQTVGDLIWRLSQAMKKHGGTKIHLAKKKDGSVLVATSTGKSGVDLRDFWEKPA
jgi:hypothetical protein